MLTKISKSDFEIVKEHSWGVRSWKLGSWEWEAGKYGGWEVWKLGSMEVGRLGGKEAYSFFLMFDFKKLRKAAILFISVNDF